MTGTNLIVFRDSAKQISADEVAAGLTAALENIRVADPFSAIDALILAGQIESALWDCEWPCSGMASALTDILAERFIGNAAHEFRVIYSVVSELFGKLPESMSFSEPEGFAYYALHPGDFADVVRSLANDDSVALIGIRSIGTTLSAIVRAQFLKQQIQSARMTIRPAGHPYDRETYFTTSQADWIDQHKSKGSTFLVLDEGPGLSGSSFLSVGESLINHGVQSDKIVLIGTRECNPNELCARDAIHRWRKFRWLRVNSRIHKRFDDAVPLSGGAWRELFCLPCAEWPASWTEMETLRFLASDRKYIVKFGGFGRAGRDALERARAVCEAGFGPPVENAGDGMHSYHFIEGYPLTNSDLSSDLLDHIARYCAFRTNEFGISTTSGNQIREMLEFNFAQETGRALNLPGGIFESATSVVIDGRMHPHEWVLARSGDVFKVDAVQHGDDHFLPGPTDIAWDLAGAIVEWSMSDQAVQRLCSTFKRYTRISRVDRLPHFVLAYSIFRAAYCEMATHATRNAADKLRFQRLHLYYRSKAEAACSSVLHDLHR